MITFASITKITIMDTSKDYYESVIRDFKTYGRGRTLEQYCRDEGADYKWIEKAAEQYGPVEKTKPAKPVRKTRSKSPDMIQLHFDSEPEDTTVPEQTKAATKEGSTSTEAEASESEWRVASLRLITPQGHEIEITTSNPSALSELLAKLNA